MRFTTQSGAVYDLYEVEGVELLTREAEHAVIDRTTGSDMESILAERVTHAATPTIGEPFSAFTEKHGWLTTTPVASIEEITDAP